MEIWNIEEVPPSLLCGSGGFFVLSIIMEFLSLRKIYSYKVTKNLGRKE